jgi:TolB protein
MPGMRSLLFGLVCALVPSETWAQPPDPRPPAPESPLLDPGETLLSNLRQITFDGLKSGEAYFSPDETMIAFQSVRGDCPHYQIFVQRLDGTRLVRVTPGQGLTTCAHFHPGEARMIWASTHLDPATYGPPPASAGPYVWDKHPSFDIFESDLEGGSVRRLTSTPGYDAEGSYSPDGARICFTSERDGDLEIYTMARDGSDVRRVTHSPGYDGGPFYSPDGQRICFRGFRDPGNPRHADIYVIDADGANERRLTDDHTVNWCPYWSPDGRWILYSKAVGGHRNFDLFIVPAEGGESIPVTRHAAADVLPVFSRDGRRIMWTSNRAGGRSQVFIADFRWPEPGGSR